VQDVTLAAATGSLTVKAGQIVWPATNPLHPLCVLTVDRTSSAGRSIANCDAAFQQR
jgi:hypothetical protein